MEQEIIQFLIALIAPFMAAFALGYFIRRSFKFIATIFGMFFLVVGVMWYAGVLPSLTPVQAWITHAVEAGYYKTQQFSNTIEQSDGNSQMNIIIGVSSFFTGLMFGLVNGNRRDREIRLVSD